MTVQLISHDTCALMWVKDQIGWAWKLIMELSSVLDSYRGRNTQTSHTWLSKHFNLGYKHDRWQMS